MNHSLLRKKTIFFFAKHRVSIHNFMNRNHSDKIILKSAAHYNLPSGYEKKKIQMNRVITFFIKKKTLFSLVI
jgi:hypothetical protein